MDIIESKLAEYSSVLSPPRVELADVFEILCLAFLIYHIILWIRNTRAWVLFKGLFVLLVVILVAHVLQFSVIIWIFSNTFNVGITALLIIFQPELRRVLEQLGRKNLVSSISFFDEQGDKNERFSDKTIENLVSATFDLAREKTGALIVIEKEMALVEYERTGIAIDSAISSQLLINIFEHNTPLHDGAVLIRGNRIVAATCYLPLSDNIRLSKELGTRHRAGIGISEVSDSLTIIVSEETGKVSYARAGRITRGIDGETLKKVLKDAQLKKNSSDFHKIKMKNWKGWFKNEKKDN